MWCLRAILRIPHSFHSRVPNVHIWEGTKSVPVSILIWERMLRYIGHLVRARLPDPTKAYTFTEDSEGRLIPISLQAPRTRSRPHDGWAAWAWGEARNAVFEVYSLTSSHVPVFPDTPHTLEAHLRTIEYASDAYNWRRICYVARCLRYQSFLGFSHAVRA